jgi:hypothetical protein
MLRIYRVAAQLVASRVIPSSTELVVLEEYKKKDSEKGEKSVEEQ